MKFGSRVRPLDENRGWAFGVAAGILKPTLLAATSRTWIDGDKIPSSGGCVLAVNHLSHIDPLLTAHFVYDHGRIPRYLAKSGLFTNRYLGGFLKSAGQIPVERLTRNAVGAFDAAVEGIRQGKCIVIYPEGTLTRDPHLWPMKGKTGAARIALRTGCPVIPVGHWGAQRLLAPYARKPDLLPRKEIMMKAGDPVDLGDLVGRPATPAALADGTERIMSAITALVADLRGEEPPTSRFDPKAAGVRPIGNFHENPRPPRRKRHR